MKMVFVSADMFDEVMNKIGAEVSSRDIGRTHGRYTYSRHYNRHVGTSSFVVRDGEACWIHQIASYLYEAHCK